MSLELTGAILGIGVLAALGAYFVGIAAVYERLSAAQRRAHLGWFLLGLSLAGLGFIPSPLLLGPAYRFTVNMAQFVLLTGLVAPLLLMGLPGPFFDPLTRSGPGKSVGFHLTRPIPAYLIANLVFFAWHTPILFELSSRNVGLWALKQFLFLSAAMLAWWPVLSPTPVWPRLSDPGQVLYLFFLAMPTTLLGALFTFPDTRIYNPTALGFEVCAPSSLEDQRLAGLFMWVPGAMIYLGALTMVFFRWFGREEA
ncbi:cytochrome c oxidase assembly protein [Thermoflexus sp.]|uniref:cytochrome c oxidase assembly protein n=2 Tax=Thermoflexus sp. TaxID=1969742 RepID=UPI002ADDEFDF|nr:cytochrome c oxidase assembly protein [Thermoflexus sp.]